MNESCAGNPMRISEKVFKHLKPIVSTQNPALFAKFVTSANHLRLLIRLYLLIRHKLSSFFKLTIFSFISEYENHTRYLDFDCHRRSGLSNKWIWWIGRVRQQYSRHDTKREFRGRTYWICSNVSWKFSYPISSFFHVLPSRVVIRDTLLCIVSQYIFFSSRISAPKENIYFPSEPIEAECRVSGTPVPTVEWVLGSGSIDVSFINERHEVMNLNEIFLFCQNNDFETNTIMEQSPTGIATVVARLIIKPHHVRAGTKRTYTCVGKSGAKVVKASSKF